VAVAVNEAVDVNVAVAVAVGEPVDVAVGVRVLVGVGVNVKVGVGVGVGAATVTVAVLDVAPAPVSLELIAPVVLFLTPAVAPVTVTEIVQFAPATRLPPVNVSTLLLTERLPPHGVVVASGVVNPAGSVSVKARPVSPVPPGFVSIKLMPTLPPKATVGLANDFEIDGGVKSSTVLLSVGELTPATVAKAVFVTNFADTSPAVTVYVAVHVTASPGSKTPSRSPTVETAGQVTDALVSETVTGPGSVAEPVLVTR
jgi:hypothetical protein